MSIITVRNITVKNNPAKFTDPFVLDVTIESHAYIKEGLPHKYIFTVIPRNRVENHLYRKCK